VCDLHLSVFLLSSDVFLRYRGTFTLLIHLLPGAFFIFSLMYGVSVLWNKLCIPTIMCIY